MPADIEMETLRQWLAEGRPVTIIDVRPAEQRAEWAIPGSRHADVSEAIKSGNEAAVASIPVPKDVPVVTVCALGRTSRKAAEFLARQGVQAHSLAGGMQAWSMAWNLAEIPIQLSGATLLQIRRAGKGCLSYLLGSAGESVVIDPSLAPETYLRLATQRNLRIRAVLDTHVHADHISRSLGIANVTGARTGPLPEGEELRIGNLALRALSTPGHTPDSVSYLLPGEAVVTGDTLFLDSVGRPDLLEGLDPREQAKLLYRSLQRLLQLEAKTRVLPGHHPTPPAFDGIPIAATMGELRSRNRYLSADESEFLSLIFAGTNSPPPNFEAIVQANRSGVLPEGNWSSLEAGPNRCARA